jgi:hypothetical protein
VAGDLHPLPAQFLIACGVVNNYRIDFTDSPHYYISPAGGLLEAFNRHIVTVSCDVPALVSILKINCHFQFLLSFSGEGRLKASLAVEVLLKSHEARIIQAVKKLVIFRPMRLIFGVIPKRLDCNFMLTGGADLLTNQAAGIQTLKERLTLKNETLLSGHVQRVHNNRNIHNILDLTVQELVKLTRASLDLKALVITPEVNLALFGNNSLLIKHSFQVTLKGFTIDTTVSNFVTVIFHFYILLKFEYSFSLFTFQSALQVICFVFPLQVSL